MANSGVDATVNEVFELLKRGTEFYGGDPITKLEHSLQTGDRAVGLRGGDSIWVNDISLYRIGLLHRYSSQAGLPDIENQFVTGSLLHDIGHVIEDLEDTEVQRMIDPEMGDIGAMDHGVIGAEYLRKQGFSPVVLELVAGHVPAKIYLVEKEQGYYAELSEASKATLKIQQQDPKLIRLDFATDPLAAAKVVLRLLDEAAKMPGRMIYPLEYYRPYLRRDLQLAA